MPSGRSITVLAFSGGLDTSYCLKLLSAEEGREVHTVTVNTGGFSAVELNAIATRARALGAAAHRTIDRVGAYYSSCVRYLLFGNVLRGNAYPLSVGAERAFQAQAVAEYAREVGAAAVAHGSTGAGNDQVRFDVVFRVLLPDIPVVTPVRDARLSREEEIAFLRSHGVELDWTKAAYSVNAGLWGTTIGGKETLTSHLPLPEEAYPSHCRSETPETVEIAFRKGEPVGMDGMEFASPPDLIAELNRRAGAYAIGRDIHVGDTILGSKGRVAFEAPAALVLIKAHHALEKHTLTRQQQAVKDQLAAVYGALVHEAQFPEPALRDIEAFFESTQGRVTGTVSVELAPYRFSILGVRSPFDLMAPRFGSYGEMNTAWTGEDVRGYARILSNQMMIHRSVGSNGDTD